MSVVAEGHNGHVEQADIAYLQTYLASRFQEWRASGRFVKVEDDVKVEDHEALTAKVNEEAATYDKGGVWVCHCECGWAGNNPYPSRKTALSSLTAHYEAH